MMAAIQAGQRSPDQLANLAFFMHHPGRNGRPISRSEPGAAGLIELWTILRDAARNMLKGKRAKTPASGGTAPAGTACRVEGQKVICGTCVADGSNRPEMTLPTSLVPVRTGLRRNRKTQVEALMLRPDTEAAWADLITAARADGIAAPLLTITSAYRRYATQANMWRDRLTGKFRKMGIGEPELSCVYLAAERANDAIGKGPIPPAESAFLDRFRKELAAGGCRIKVAGISDPVARAVNKLAVGTARPGRSKHQSGRAVDIYLGISNRLENAGRQRKTAAFLWLVCNASRFGFVPYVKEPWHWEYKG
jgi:hypothetical protein